MTTQFAEKLSVNKYAEERDNTSGPLGGAAITAGHLFPSTLEAVQRGPPALSRGESEKSWPRRGGEGAFGRLHINFHHKKSFRPRGMEPLSIGLIKGGL